MNLNPAVECRKPVYFKKDRLASSALIAFAICGITGTAHADHPGLDFGATTAGPIRTIAAATLPKGAKALGIAIDHLQSDQFSDDSLKSFAAQGISAHSLKSLTTAALAFSYGATDDLTFGLRLPYVRRLNIREGESADEVHEHGTSKGIGDLTLLGKYRVLTRQRNGVEGALLLGLKMPTGDTRVSDRTGARFETEHQPGSGSWDPVLGGAVSTPLGKATLHASVLYTVAGHGAQNTTLADRAQYGVALTWRFGGEAHSDSHAAAGGHVHDAAHESHSREMHAHPAWDVVLELNGEQEGRQRIAGIDDPNSGGHRLFLSPGLRFVSGSGWAAYLSVGVPVAQRLNGVQTDVTTRIVAGVAFSLP